MSSSQEYAGLTPMQLAMIKSAVHDDKTNIIDTDAHFTVDVKNKLIVSSDKRKLVQFSHNSERVTFDCDRYIEGHDIMLCNVKQIHYLDDGIYDIDDLEVNPEDDTKVTFSWLISGNATKQVIKEVPFSLILECVQEDGTCTYSWDTEENTSLYVVKGRRNSQNVVYQYADVLEQWKQQFGGGGSFSGSASDVTYDDTETKLGADNVQDAIGKVSEQIVTQAKPDEDGIVSFKNSQGLVLFTLDLSEFGGSANVYGDIVLSKEFISIGEGSLGTFTVKLASAPTTNQPVYLAVSDNTKLSVSPSTLTFTPENWETEQVVTVTALEDEDEDNNEITVSLTSKKVDAKSLIVSITDNDGLAIVTDGLVLHMNYSGLTDYTEDTITDPISGMTFKGFSTFAKVENGIKEATTLKYLEAVKDDAKTSFVESLKETGEFTIEMFGTTIGTDFYAPHYRKLIEIGSNYAIGVERWFLGQIGTSATRILQDDTVDYTSISALADGTYPTYTIDGVSKQIIYWNVSAFPYANEFRHIVITYSKNGEVTFYVNGVKCDTSPVVENFKAWDFDTMFGGDFSLTNSTNSRGNNYISNQRIYNRVLTDAEVVENMKANAVLLELMTF